MVRGADFRGCSRVQENQAQGIVVPFEDFRAEYESRLTSIGHLLAMMAPWDYPVYLTRVRAELLCASLCLSKPISLSAGSSPHITCIRTLPLLAAQQTLPTPATDGEWQVWCVYELFTAVTCSGCIVTVGMPPAQAEAMLAALFMGAGLQKLWEVLGSIKVADAQASLDNDRVRILELIEQSVGFAALDARVSEFLRDWVLATAEAHMAELLRAQEPTESTARVCQIVGILLCETGKLERAA